MREFEQKLRRFVNLALHNPCTRMARAVNGGLTFLILFSVAVIPLHFLPGAEWIRDELFLFDRITVTIFTVEYFLRIWSAERKLRYIFSWWGLIDLVAILPFYLARIGLIGTGVIFMGLRIFRILKLGKIYEMEVMAIQQCRRGGHGEFVPLPGENVERVAQKHPIIFLMELVLPIVMLGCGLAILVFFRGGWIAGVFAGAFFFLSTIFFAKAWLDYNYDVMYITDKRVVLQDRALFGVSKNEISYESITNTMPENFGIIHWMLGFGNVRIETAGTDQESIFSNVSDPHGLVKIISKNRHRMLEKVYRKTENEKNS